jgi:hypothetical protein
MRIMKIFYGCVVVSLTATLFWADLSWGQRRDGSGPFCPVNPNAAGFKQPQGQGPGVCQYYSGNPGQGQCRGPRGQGRQGSPPGQKAPTSPVNPSLEAK